MAAHARVKEVRGITRPEMLPLGFGCAELRIAKIKQQSLDLVRMALDCGITYFDTARLYGVGESEHILGEATANLRDELILVSKVGILPTPRSLTKRVADRARETVRKLVPPLRRYVRGALPALPRFDRFSPSDMRSSVEQSLRALRTDRIDILLLHECSRSHAADPEVLGVLEALKGEGKIRAFGIAPTIEEAKAILAGGRRVWQVVQFPNSVWDRNIESLLLGSGSLPVTHSPLSTQFRAFAERLHDDAALAAAYSAHTGLDPADRIGLAQIALSHALRANAGGVVLFSSAKPQNIRACVEAARKPLFEDAQIDGLLEVVVRASGAPVTG